MDFNTHKIVPVHVQIEYLREGLGRQASYMTPGSRNISIPVHSTSIQLLYLYFYRNSSILTMVKLKKGAQLKEGKIMEGRIMEGRIMEG